MSSEDPRCMPEVTGLAADVNRVLGRHRRVREEPKRFSVPTEPGVYRAVRPIGGEILVQLSEQGQWWPYPYRFSGWRVSELSLFELFPLAELELDVPEILNPEVREAIQELTEDLLEAFPELDRKAVEAFSRKRIEASY